jgi:hypothetical protein
MIKRGEHEKNIKTLDVRLIRHMTTVRLFAIKLLLKTQTTNKWILNGDESEH